jgi:hypothetical protein
MGKSNAVGLCSELAILNRYYRADRRVAGYGSLRMTAIFGNVCNSSWHPTPVRNGQQS